MKSPILALFGSWSRQVGHLCYSSDFCANLRPVQLNCFGKILKRFQILKHFQIFLTFLHSILMWLNFQPDYLNLQMIQGKILASLRHFMTVILILHLPKTSIWIEIRYFLLISRFLLKFRQNFTKFCAIHDYVVSFAHYLFSLAIFRVLTHWYRLKFTLFAVRNPVTNWSLSSLIAQNWHFTWHCPLSALTFKSLARTWSTVIFPVYTPNCCYLSARPN